MATPVRTRWSIGGDSAELDALGEGEFVGVVDGVGGPAHVGLPRVAAALAAAAGGLLAAEGSADLGTLGPMLTLAIPQSLPSAAQNRSASRTSVVKMLLARPCGTPFCSAIASSKSS